MSHTDTSKDYFTRYALAAGVLEYDAIQADFALKAIDIVDGLCAQNGFTEDSSTRHNLAIARASVHAILQRRAAPNRGEHE